MLQELSDPDVRKRYQGPASDKELQALKAELTSDNQLESLIQAYLDSEYAKLEDSKDESE